MDEDSKPEGESADEATDQESEPTGPGEETDAEPPTGESDEDQTEDTESGAKQPSGGGSSPEVAERRRPGTVFVPNPNGYPRPPVTYLPTHPWLRLPSRAPTHETVSVNR